MLKIFLICLGCFVAGALFALAVVNIRSTRKKLSRKKMKDNIQFRLYPVEMPKDRDTTNSVPPWASYSASYCPPPASSASPVRASMACPAPDFKNLEADMVQFSAIAPKTIKKGEFFSVDISVFEDEYREIVDKIIKNRDEETKEIFGSSTSVFKNTNIKISLSSPDLELSDCTESQVWHGKYLVYNFIAELPEDYAKKQILFVASIYFDDIISSKLKFLVNCEAENPEKLSIERKDIRSAFVSYSSADRPYVATIIQGMRKGRPDLDIYCDIEKLQSGDNWEKVLFDEIEKRDVLFLCWSKNAKNSKEVEKEWRHALSKKGLDGIDPIPLESPKVCPPPEELKSKHFNDLAVLYRYI